MKQYKSYKNNLYVLKFYFTHAPFYSTITLLNAILQRVSFVLLLQYSLLLIIDNIEGGKSITFVSAIIGSVFLFSVSITFVDRLLDEYYKNKINEKLTAAIQEQLFNASLKQKTELFDDTKFYDNFYSAALSAEDKFAECFFNFVDILSNITSVALLGSLLLSLSYGATVIILVSYILSLVNNIHLSKLTYNIEREKRVFERKYSYYDKIFCLFEYLKEMKIHGAKDMLFQRIDSAYEENEKLYCESSKKLILYEKIFPFLIDFVLGDLLYNGILLYQAIGLNKLSIGGFSALFFTAGSIKGSIAGLQGSLLKFFQLSNYICELRYFIDSVPEDEGMTVEDTLQEDIEVRNLSYKYYNENKYALKNVSLKIPYGKKIAIVGTNGAGKSTFIKLLMNLYELQEGEILIGGKNIKDIKRMSYQNLFGTVFQEFNIYALTVEENILMDIGSKDEECKIRYALEKLQLDQDDNFVQDLQTRLTVQFDKNDKNLSGGQKQKVAITRVIYANKNYIILDEPSSALDPLSEYMFNQTIAEHAKERTVIMISHRLSTTKDADLIYVFDHGELLESGNHIDLMKQNGLYSEMFLAQSKKYT
ncbi:MAG TPA: hypothetical protein DCW90_15800 [Lachnospiraceae bacterium]|nr:ABC transporter ATP-binding protein [uncultured Lachnoclostridium sp.]HAU86894.1 hypothetical protein [Lachnospiraceae bacterium]